MLPGDGIEDRPTWRVLNELPGRMFYWIYPSGATAAPPHPPTVLNKCIYFSLEFALIRVDAVQLIIAASGEGWVHISTFNYWNIIYSVDWVTGLRTSHRVLLLLLFLLSSVR